jgi:hypothetical protein
MVKQDSYSEGMLTYRTTVGHLSLSPLGRFNSDKPKGPPYIFYDAKRSDSDSYADVYEGELERMNAAMIEDNHALQRDNKQLNALIKEYEQTLENVMAAFRNRAVC